MKGPTLDDKKLYSTGFDELFISFGKNVANNVFNQNRLLLGVGYQVNDDFQLELGTTQHAESDLLAGKRVFVINNGFQLNVNYCFHFTR